MAFVKILAEKSYKSPTELPQARGKPAELSRGTAAPGSIGARAADRHKFRQARAMQQPGVIHMLVGLVHNARLPLSLQIESALKSRPASDIFEPSIGTYGRN